MISTLKYPSAWVPIAMSVAVMLMLAGFFIANWGRPIVREPDEGVAAHVFQLLMGGQLPIIAFFAAKWLPRKPREALQVLAVQLFAGIIACAPVFILRL